MNWIIYLLNIDCTELIYLTGFIYLLNTDMLHTHPSDIY